MVTLRADAILTRVLAKELEDRFLGKHGDGDATFLRKILHLESKGDAKALSGVELRAYFSFAQLNGMETEEQWVSKWEINRRRAGKRLLD